MHTSVHPQAGETIKVDPKGYGFQDGPKNFVVEDWWDRLGQGTWREQAIAGNFAAMKYADRLLDDTLNVLPDDEVVYGKIGGLGYLLHASELGGEPAAKTSQKDTARLLITLFREGTDFIETVVDGWSDEDNPVQELALAILVAGGEKFAEAGETVEVLTQDGGLGQFLGELGDILSSTFGEKSTTDQTTSV